MEFKFHFTCLLLVHNYSLSILFFPAFTTNVTLPSPTMTIICQVLLGKKIISISFAVVIPSHLSCKRQTDSLDWTSESQSTTSRLGAATSLISNYASYLSQHTYFLESQFKTPARNESVAAKRS